MSRGVLVGKGMVVGRNRRAGGDEDEDYGIGL